MSRIERFEDIRAWQKSRVLTATIYQTSEVGKFARDFPLRDQIRGAAISTQSNIAEGFERNRPREFHQFLSIAKASCAEVRHICTLHSTLDILTTRNCVRCCGRPKM